MLNQIHYLNPPSPDNCRLWIDLCFYFVSCADRIGLMLTTAEDGIKNLAKLGEVSRFTLNMHNHCFIDQKHLHTTAISIRKIHRER